MAVFGNTDPFADDAEEVNRIASILQISEFQLFHTAYLIWFGKKLTDKEMETFFIEYMFKSIVPYWVRCLVRNMDRRIEEGQDLNLDEFYIERPQLSPDAKTKGVRYAFLLTVLFILYCAMLISTPSS